MRPEQVTEKDVEYLSGMLYSNTKVWLSTMEMFVRPNVDKPTSPKDYDYAFHLMDNRLTGVGIFVDHTGFIGEMERVTVTMHDDWVECESLIDLPKRDALLSFVTDRLLFASSIELGRCVDMARYSKERIELIEYGKHQVELSKTVIAEAMRNNIPPATYARIVGEKLSLDWLTQTVTEVVERRAVEKKWSGKNDE
jgi:hypothetical protein